MQTKPTILVGRASFPGGNLRDFNANQANNTLCSAYTSNGMSVLPADTRLLSSLLALLVARSIKKID